MQILPLEILSFFAMAFLDLIPSPLARLSRRFAFLIGEEYLKC